MSAVVKTYFPRPKTYFPRQFTGDKGTLEAKQGSRERGSLTAIATAKKKFHFGVWLLAAALAVFGMSAIAAPVVSLTAPANNSKYTPPATITLTATATDSAATITKVEFFQGGSNLIGTVTSAPYTFNWASVPTGAYAITAKATNASGVSRTSAARNIVVNTAPTIIITSPKAGTIFYGLASVNLAVNAADPDGSVAKVQYFKGGTLIGTTTTAPFSYAWNGVAPGNYNLTAKATDNLGALVTSAVVAIIVKNPVEVAITAPATNSKFNSPGNLTFTADAITRTCDTCSAPVTRVDYTSGSGTSTTVIGTATSAPYTFNWINVPAGKYTIKAIATDAQGLSLTSKAITITVNTPPTIAITSPTSGATAAGLATFNITTNVTDPDNNVTKVQLFRSGTLLSTVTAPPYTFNWANVAPGNYNLTAKATDSLGAVVTSAGVAVTVTNPVSVAIVNPLNKDRYLPGAPISLTAAASDANTIGMPPPMISDVTYYAGTSTSAPVIGASTTAPYEVIWNNVPVGIYNIIAVATDTQGIAKTSTPVKITVDATPDVTITAPNPNSTYALGSTVTLAATAQNPAGATIAKVQFYAKGKLVSTVTTPPYTTNWTPTVKGSYAITAKATDSLTVSTTSSPVNVGIVVGSAPAVAITSPATNALYLTAPATIDLNAAASTLTGTVSSVEFFKTQNNITTSIGQGALTSGGTTGGIYKLTWSNVTPDTYTLTAKATNSVNLVTISDPITVVVDAAPSLTLTSPINNAVYQAGDNIAISVNASDSDGTIAKVDFYQGTTLLATVTSGAAGVFTTNWSSVAAGTYSLTATATDNLGATTTTPSINVTVNAPPTVTWTAPTDGTTATAAATVTLTVNATDSDGTINKVDFYSGSALIGSILAGQSGNSGNNYIFNWTNIAGGTYTLSAIATDNNGATVNAGNVTVIVNTPPTINISSPANNSTQNAPANIVITANASDSDGTVSQVDFYSGPNLIASVAAGQAGNTGNTGNTYSFNWTNVVSGAYTLTAIATDNLNASTTSQTVTVNVNAITAEAGIYYIHPDHLGTPRAITRSTDNLLVWKWDNTDPFGANLPNENPSGLGTFTCNLRFPGQYYDQETGTHYNYFRDYSPSEGRYVQSDPIGLKGGINTYVYVDNNPLSTIDPQGLRGMASCAGSWSRVAFEIRRIMVGFTVTPGPTCECFWACIPCEGTAAYGNYKDLPSSFGATFVDYTISGKVGTGGTPKAGTPMKQDGNPKRGRGGGDSIGGNQCLCGPPGPETGCPYCKENYIGSAKRKYGSEP